MKKEDKNNLPDFQIDISKIKIAGSEKDVSKTIEELLELNKMIPERWDEPPKGITQEQFETSKKSETVDWRGEEEEITQAQFGEREEPNYQIIEVEAESKSPSDLGHNEDAWDKDDIEMRGHKNVPPIWLEVYQNEDERKEKGELDKNLKEKK